ncbi:oligoendopeptidase F [Christensenellaceae bacterium OttesenSCG-928-K19]|nr:oligoendopeptidase F [Christensenellaceae bacterium OttesenSCG-928-K19]
MAQRDKIDEKYKWKLEDIYQTDGDWEKDFMKLEELFEGISSIKENLTKSAKGLYAALYEMEQMEHIAANLFVYARMRRDEDNTSAVYQAMTQKATEMSVRLSSALSFVNPALLALEKGVIERWLEKADEKKSLKGLKNYDFMLRELLRGKKHVLSAKEEKILSMSGEIAGAPKDIFTMLNNADLQFGSVKNEKGRRVPLTHGSYIVLMQSPDREVRKKAYENLYKVYKQNINTISTAYAASVKKDIFYAKARKFKRAIERPLFADNVPVELYDNLIGTVHKNLPTMHRYVNLRKRILKLDELHMYDIYAPLVADVENDYPFEKSMRMVKQGLAPLGKEYAALLDASVKDRWIDVQETPGKTSGAYSWGVYGVHPYVLLNHRGDLDSVFTIAHELGHAMHTHYSNTTQPEAKAGYTIFVAEVASTVNEILLTHYLLDTVKAKKQRQYILNHYLDQFRTTVMRQTMFAEFEKMAHGNAENGLPLTFASLCEMYGDLNAQYHGAGMQRDEQITYEWARIPHFYNAFYVYKYATGFSCAVQIAADILSGRKGAVSGYIEFLSAGGSDHPLNLLKIANVDLASGRPVEVCMKEFDKALTEFEKAL